MKRVSSLPVFFFSLWHLVTFWKLARCPFLRVQKRTGNCTNGDPIWTTRKLKIICYPSRPTYPLTHPTHRPTYHSHPCFALVPGNPPGSQPEVSCFWRLTPLTYYYQFRINTAQPLKWNWVILVGWWGWLFWARRQGYSLISVNSACAIRSLSRFLFFCGDQFCDVAKMAMTYGYLSQIWLLVK
jgi:hypothetical protein